MSSFQTSMSVLTALAKMEVPVKTWSTVTGVNAELDMLDATARSVCIFYTVSNNMFSLYTD